MGVKLGIYEAIKAALEALVDGNGVRCIETVGIWNNQFTHEEEETAVNYPAVYVEFSSIPWDTTNIQPIKVIDKGNKIGEQKAQPVIITLHCGFSDLDDATLAFENIEPILEKIFFGIQGITALCVTALLRSDERQDVEHDRVLDWQMDFTTSFQQPGEDDGTLTKIDPNTLTLELTRDLDIHPDTVGDIRTGPE